MAPGLALRELGPDLYSSDKQEPFRHEPCRDITIMHDFLRDVQVMFQDSVSPSSLCHLSHKLQHEFHEKLNYSKISMLPSYHQHLPSGLEKGSFLALDIGGTNLRIASIELNGKDSREGDIRIKGCKSFHADAVVRSLQGYKFFDWIATKIQEVLSDDANAESAIVEPIRMGIAWSFPLDQTSTRSARLLQMGKGFLACDGVEDLDLCDLITDSCKRKGFEVNVQSIVNDASAALLAQAYREPSTRLSLILGTGLNAAIYLPLRAVATQKYENRPSIWAKTAKHVVINTELSMYGGNIWPSTRWDKHLNDHHSLPDFQPLEQRVSGRYLGEIVRLILVEAIQSIDLFNGVMPTGFVEPYSLCTSILAEFERDSSFDLAAARSAFLASHFLEHGPEEIELHFVKAVCQLVSTRAAALVATAIHALCNLADQFEDRRDIHEDMISIACDGSVLEKYPGFMQRCQTLLDQLMHESGRGENNVTFVLARDSSILGAAVGAACE